MAYTSIEITFNRDLEIGEVIRYHQSYHNYQTGQSTVLPDVIETWVATRMASSQVPEGIPNETIGERSAINFAQYVRMDYYSWIPTSGTILGVFRSGNKVTIKTDKEYQLSISGITIPDDVVIKISNFGEVGYPFYIRNLIYSQADSNPCQNVKLSVESSNLAVKITSPILVDPNTENPYEFNLLRGQNYTITLEDEDSEIITQRVSTPGILDVNNFELQINNSPNGATVVVNSDDIIYEEIETAVSALDLKILELEYSLDNSTWQTSNVFSGLAAGNYTLFVRDQLGCSTSIDFQVDEFGIQSPYFYIGKANSIRFANRITWGDATNYKNDENTLSCEVRDKLPYMEVQQFQTADVITTQFKSNYENHEVKVIKENGVEVDVPVIKKTTFIGNKDSRDARKYDLGYGKTGIYFISGNIYDFDTVTDTGEDHYLNGGLPNWAKAGNYVKVDTEWFLIEDFVYDDDKNAEVIIISSNYSGPDVAVIVGSIFNIFNFEVYEFTIDMVDYINEEIQVRIQALDSHFTTITYLSEKIDVKVRHAECLEIRYWNDDNTDIFYASEIKHLIRLPFTKIIDASDEDSENNKSDNSTILVSAEIYEGSEITFEPTTLEIMRKLRIALNCKNLLIDGIAYVINGNVESEQKDDSNLYVVKVKLIKAGGSFSAKSEGLNDLNSSSVEIPGLISIGGDGMLKY